MRPILQLRLFRPAFLLALAGAGALVVPPAAALAPPKVVIEYSFRVPEGGGFLYNVTNTPFGLGDTRGWVNTELPQFDDPVTTNEGADRIVPLCSERPQDPDCSAQLVPQNDDGPMRMVLEFTADEEENIVDGPVEIVGWDMVYLLHLGFPTGDPGETISWGITDNEETLHESVTGTLSGTTIAWDGATPGPGTEGHAILEVDSGTISDCDPVSPEGEGICALGAPSTGWPRDDSGIRPRPIPAFSVSTESEFADRIVTDNGTPSPPSGNELDDVVVADDDQTLTYATFYGAQVDRTFVPEPDAAAVALAALAGLAALRRVRSA